MGVLDVQGALPHTVNARPNAYTLPAGTKCPTNEAVSNSSRSGPDRPCTQTNCRSNPIRTDAAARSLIRAFLDPARWPHVPQPSSCGFADGPKRNHVLDKPAVLGDPVIEPPDGVVVLSGMPEQPVTPRWRAYSSVASTRSRATRGRAPAVP
jgi:hypothetical protein